PPETPTFALWDRRSGFRVTVRQKNLTRGQQVHSGVQREIKYETRIETCGIARNLGTPACTINLARVVDVPILVQPGRGHNAPVAQFGQSRIPATVRGTFSRRK